MESAGTALFGGLGRYWLVACRSRELRRRPVARVVLGTPLALFRGEDGTAGALVDRCPHRNVPLSLGRVAGPTLRCAYHGWRFDASGACREVPGLPGEPSAKGRDASAWRCVERDGFVWTSPARDAEPAAPPHAMPWSGDRDWAVVRYSYRLEAPLHAALENILDVPHTSFLHGGLFRTERRRAEITAVVRRSADRVEAEFLGEPAPAGLLGRVLAPEGGTVGHVDRFVLPSVAEVEYRLGRKRLLAVHLLTPETESTTRAHLVLGIQPRALGLVAIPLLWPVARRVLAQDARLLARQSANVRRFGGERFSSTDIDLVGAHVAQLLRAAERGEVGAGEPVEKRVRMLL